LVGIARSVRPPYSIGQRSYNALSHLYKALQGVCNDD
jgi:hypothetical protein